MISINEVTMNFGSRMLFDSVTVTFNEGERYGLTGPNGAGKSTFMKIVAKELDPVSGHVSLPRRFGIRDRITLSSMPTECSMWC